MSRARQLVVPLAIASSVFATALVGGCSDDADPENIDASPSCIEATTHADLEWLQPNVFTPGCSNFVSCHKGAATQAGGLNLEAGRTQAALVNKPSTRFTTWTLVVPGDAVHSYLMVVLGQYPGPLDDRIGTMPFNSRLLCREKRDAIERWIMAGAPGAMPVDAGVDAP